MWDSYSYKESINIQVDEKIWKKLEKDKDYFEIKSNNDLCNRILFYYLTETDNQDDAEKIKNSIRKNTKAGCDKFCMNTIIGIVENILYPSVKLAGKPKAANIRLNNKVKDIYNTYVSDAGANFSQSEFIRKIFEWFCNKPKYEREKILFNSEYNELKRAIEERRRINITILTSNKKLFKTSCFPIGIFSSKEETSFYLIGIDKKDTNIYPTGLSSIKNIHLANRFEIVDDKDLELGKIYGDRVGKSRVEEANERIKNRDNTIGKYIHIIGYLTEQGKKEYEHIPTNRPLLKFTTLENCGDYKYKFEYYGTAFSVKRYFMRFGKECKIVGPKILEEEFIKFYKEAIEIYK